MLAFIRYKIAVNYKSKVCVRKMYSHSRAIRGRRGCTGQKCIQIKNFFISWAPRASIAMHWRITRKKANRLFGKPVSKIF